MNHIWVGPGLDMDEEIITLSAVGSRKGDAAEAEFIARACGLSFRLAKPWGNIDPYDVLVGMRRGFWRVQVKCATRRPNGGYEANGGSHKCKYTKNEIDFLAAWIIRENIWYIVPVEAFEGRGRLHFHPGAKLSRGQNKFEHYREAWCLLACPPKARGWKDIPVVCRSRELPVRCAVCPCKRSVVSG